MFHVNPLVASRFGELVSRESSVVGIAVWFGVEAACAFGEALTMARRVSRESIYGDLCAGDVSRR
jgi:hypothetical protein